MQPLPPAIWSQSTDASPKVRGDIAPRPSLSVPSIALELMDPVAMLEDVRLVFVPQQGTELEDSHCELEPVVTHRDSHHLTATYSSGLSSAFDAYFKENGIIP